MIDVSGSMGGTSIDQARSSALAALARLTPQDRINIITFSNETNQLFDKAMPLTAEIRAQCEQFIQSLTADGGTYMVPALWQRCPARRRMTTTFARSSL